MFTLYENCLTAPTYVLTRSVIELQQSQRIRLGVKTSWYWRASRRKNSKNSDSSWPLCPLIIRGHYPSQATSPGSAGRCCHLVTAGENTLARQSVGASMVQCSITHIIILIERKTIFWSRESFDNKFDKTLSFLLRW